MIYSSPLQLLIILAGAVLLDILLGDPPNRFHPVAWMGSWIAALWKHHPDSSPRLFLFGIFIIAAGALVFITPLLLWYRIVHYLPLPVELLLSIIILKPAFSLHKLLKVAGVIAGKLKAGDLEAARNLTAYHLVSRPTEKLTREEISGAVIESVSENLTDSFISPLLFFLFFGLPGAWFYRYVNTCDAMLGYREGAEEWGGKAPARLDDLLNLIPARLTGLFILAAGPAVGKLPFRSTWKLLFDTHERSLSSPNAGWTIGAAAFLLGIRLEKRGFYAVFPSGRAPVPDDILRCRTLVQTAAALFCLVSMLTLSARIL